MPSNNNKTIMMEDVDKTDRYVSPSYDNEYIETPSKVA